MAQFLTIDDFDLKDKVVLIRVDINSSFDPKSRKILDDTRIITHAETIKELLEKGAKVVVLAHQGRPGSIDFVDLEKHSKKLGEIINKQVKFVDDIFGEKAEKAIKNLKSGDILILDNVRFFLGEMEKKTPEEHAKTDLVKNLVPLVDIYINDAFASAHRSHASLVGFTVDLPAAAGRVMEKELKTLNKVMKVEKKPCIYVLGGSKADDAATISEHVLKQGTADYILMGGVIGNLFLYAKGYNLGDLNVQYLKKKGLVKYVSKIQIILQKYDGKILLPRDVAINFDNERRILALDDLPTKYPIYDIGPETIRVYMELLKKAKIIVLSGPMGVYEKKQFLAGTKGVFEAIARSKAFSVAGGGHTIAALRELGLIEQISYVSTGGGALTEFLMGKKLPVVSALEKAAARVKLNQ